MTATTCRTLVLATLLWGASAAAMAGPQATAKVGQPPEGATSATEEKADATPTPRVAHVRGVGPEATALVERGVALSPTFARLVETLDASDVMVYVQTGTLKVAGQTQFAAATSQGRFLRITLTTPDAEAVLLGWLGHELQHAVEVAGAPEVRDAASLAQYYRAHGQQMGAEAYCTREAQRVTSVVRYEVAAGPRSGR